jgi:excisionase family DNA binding protein
MHVEPITTTIAGTKAATGLGVTTIYKLIGEGRLETTKVGNRTLVKIASIKALLGEAA